MEIENVCYNCTNFSRRVWIGNSLFNEDRQHFIVDSFQVYPAYRWVVEHGGALHPYRDFYYAVIR